MVRRTYILFFLLLITVEAVLGQNYQGESLPHATTFHWSFENRVQLLDRSHIYGDQNYDRGFRAEITALTPREYVLDMFTNEHSFIDAYLWDKKLEGIQVHFGSYTKSELAVYNRLKKNISVSDHSSFDLTSVLQQDGRASRAFFEFRYNYSLSENHTLSLAHTLTEEKQDLDLTFGYTFNSTRLGSFQLDVTYQNYLNNLVWKVGNDGGRRWQNFDDDIIKNTPLFIFTRYHSLEDRFWYLDVSAGYQPELRVDKKIFNESDFLVEQAETIYFVNGSLSFRFRNMVLGSFMYRDYSDLYRSSPTSDPVDGFYRATQKLSKAGFFGYSKLGRFKPHFRLSFEKYSDLQRGTDFSYSPIPEQIDYKDQRILFDLGTSFEVKRDRFRIMLKYLSLDRNIDANKLRIYAKYYGIEAYNETDKRMALSFQLNPGKNFFIEVGASYDVDQDRRGGRRYVFDKGFGKLWFIF